MQNTLENISQKKIHRVWVFNSVLKYHFLSLAPPDGPYYIYEEGREASKGSTMSASTDITPISENISTLPRSDYDDQGSVAGRINYGYGLGIPPPSIAESPLTPRRLDLDQVSLASSSISHSGARKGSGAFMGFDENGRPVTYGQMMEGKRRMRTNSDGAGSYRSYDNKGRPMFPEQCRFIGYLRTTRYQVV